MRLLKAKCWSQKNPRLLVSDGFYDKANQLRDAKTSTRGLQLFEKWFSKRKHDSPLSNVWEFDIGKLVVPSVFFDDDFLVMIAKRYDPMSRMVKSHIGDNLFRV